MRVYSDDSEDESYSYSKEEELLLKLDEDTYDGGSVSIYTLKHFIQ